MPAQRDMKLVEALRVYAITPDGFAERPNAPDIIAACVDLGVTAVQYRDKRELEAFDRMQHARGLQNVCRALDVPFFINDDPGLASAIEADGVHVGPADADVETARGIVGDEMWIGASVGTVRAAKVALTAGADYLGVGAIYDAGESKVNASKPRGTRVLKRMRKVPEIAGVPIVAIGGIRPGNAGACIIAGADGVASIRSLLGAEEPSEAARRLSSFVGLGFHRLQRRAESRNGDD